MTATGRCRGVVVALVGFGVLAIAPVAHAAWPPKWLLAPHHKYMLEYDASRSSHGTSVESFPQEDRCEHYVVNSQGSSTSNITASYEFVFGRVRVRSVRGTSIQFGLAWRLKHRSTSGQDNASASGSIPTDCPNYSASTNEIGGPVNASCSDRLEGGRTEVEILSAAPLANPKRFHLELTPETEATQQVCSQDNSFAPRLGIWPRHFMPTYPGSGTLAFTKAGVLARRTFHGTIETTDPYRNAITPQDGHGTDPEGGGEGQDVWSNDFSSTYSFTLAPARGGRR